MSAVSRSDMVIDVYRIVPSHIRNTVSVRQHLLRDVGIHPPFENHHLQGLEGSFHLQTGTPSDCAVHDGSSAVLRVVRTESFSKIREYRYQSAARKIPNQVTTGLCGV
jgi:hypothetical protein